MAEESMQDEKRESQKALWAWKMSKSREEGARSHLREIFSGALELTGGFDRRGNITEWFRAQKGESDQPRIKFQSYHLLP